MEKGSLVGTGLPIFWSETMEKKVLTNDELTAAIRGRKVKKVEITRYSALIFLTGKRVIAIDTRGDANVHLEGSVVEQDRATDVVLP
jgi:hypothetical protein